ncbi:MAG: tetratricopeptide repeat protein [Gemmatimonadota bacterium]
MKQLIHEIHRRSLWQVLGIYLGTCWIALQIVEILTESVGLPEWVQPFAIVLLVIGFPIVLATAFVQEGMGSRDTAAPPAPAERQEPAPPEAAAVEPTSVEASSSEPDQRQHPVTAAPETGAHHRLLTWRNAVLGGVAAFALLGVVTAGYMTMRTMGIGPAGTLVAKGAMDERALVILVDFQSSDSLLARAATEAFRVDLSQSPVVRLADPSFVSNALQRMELSADEPLDADLGREIAVREGVGAVIAGEINPVGTRFLLTAQVLAPEDGAVLTSHRETAADSSEIIPALDKLSRKLRERIGESYTSMQGDEPLEQATTADLEALRLYSQALQADIRGDTEREVALLEEAVALDTAFAMAWRKLGVILGNRRQQRARSLEALTKAYEHRDRLTKRERYFATASYFQQGTNEPEKAIPAYENLIELDPEDQWALNNLAIAYEALRDYPRMEEFLERAIDADSADAALSLSNLHWNLIVQGRWDEADGALEKHRRLFPDDPAADANEAGALAARGEYEAARDVVESLRAEHTGSLFWRGRTSSRLARIAAAQGQLAEAEGHRADGEAVAVQRGLPSEALDQAMDPVWYDVRVREDMDHGAERLREALERYSWEEMPALDRPYGELVALTALSGQPDRARQVLAEFEQEVPAELRSEPSYRRAVGAIALAEGAYEDAIDEFRRSDVGFCRLCPLPGLAESYDRAGQADSAIAVYERFVSMPIRGRSRLDSTELGRTLERLGELFDEAGEWEKAAEYYARFVELWKDADPELQSRVEAAQQRLNEIFAERG